MKETMKKILSIVLAIMLVLSSVTVVYADDVDKASIRSKLLNYLYGGAGGSISCDFDGYVSTNGRHEGIDCVIGKGKNVYSIADGTVTAARVASNGLSTLAIYNSTNNLTIVYLHAESFFVSAGATVKRGDLIALEGSAGASSAHTHVELRLGKQTSAAKSLNDNTLDNPNPYPYYNTLFGSTSIPVIPNADDIHFTSNGVTSNGFSVYWNFSNCSQVVVLINSIALNQEVGSLTLPNNYTYDFGIGNPSWGNEFEVRLIPDGDHSRTHYLRYGDKENLVVLPSGSGNTHDMSEGVRFINDGVTASGFSVYWNFPNCSQVVVLIKSIALNKEVGSLTLSNKYDYNFNVRHIEWGNVFEVQLIPDGDHSRTHYLRYGDVENCVVLPSPVLTAVSLDSQPTKTNYYLGEPLDTTGVALKLHYSNGLQDTITSGFTATGFDSNTVGIQTITFSYKGFSASCNVVVGYPPVTLSSMSLSSAPTKTVYSVGEPLNTDGIVLTLHYSDGSQEKITSGFTTSGFDSSAAGTKKVTVNYEGFTTSFTVTVNEVNTYTVSYDANGGTGAPSSQSKTHGVSLTLSGTKPTRTGYTFQGWATSSSATTASYQPGGTYTANSSTTLYAVWKAKSDDVHFESLTSDGFSLYIDLANCITGQVVIEIYTESGAHIGSLTWQNGTIYNFERTNASWGNKFTVILKPDGTTDESKYHYVNGKGNYVELPQSITYTVSYNANGGSGAPASQIKTPGVSLTLSNTKPTRTGYTFQGWATSSTATTATYQPGGTYTVDSETTLYAVWKRNTYTVTYNANGGSGVPLGQTKTYGISLTLSDLEPVRAGYTFQGWATSKSATVADYQPGDNYTADASVTLYAVWKEEDSPVKVIYAIFVGTQPTKTVYEIGDSLDTTGLTITILYSDTSTETITEGFTASGFDSSTAGTKTVTVNYEGFTTSFTVTVNEETKQDSLIERIRKIIQNIINKIFKWW